MNELPLRRKTFYKLSSEIARLDGARLQSLLETSDPGSGWGRSHTADLGKSKVFVKRLPVTDVEYENLFSTRNLYELPTYYNYGVGSAGFGAFRELTGHLKTTQWVLDGESETFPLLYHHRLLPFSGARAELDIEWHRGYIGYWGSSEQIGKYMVDRANASHELVLFLEYFPYVLAEWLVDHSAETERIMDDLRATVAFMRKKGMIHFDAHFWNIVTDGDRPYLTDFGLVLDNGFALTKTEETFFRQHTHYDYGLVLNCLRSIPASAFRRLSEEDMNRLAVQFGFAADSWSEAASSLIENIEKVQADGILGLQKSCSNSIVKYRSILLLMEGFFSSLTRNPKKDTPYPNAELKRMLKQTGYL